MEQWISELEKWSSAHQPLVNLIQALAPLLGFTVLGVIATVVKPIRSAIMSAFLKIWSWSKSKKGRPDLRFVPIPHRCVFAVTQGPVAGVNAKITRCGT